jgi:tRNA A-37 threonylcarbamoyl transferase component Bud32
MAEPPSDPSSSDSRSPTLPTVDRQDREASTLPTAVPGGAVSTFARTPPGYEFVEELGRGGMGVVYKARHEKLNRFVAVKMILSGGHANHEELARFHTEAEAIARLQHPNIVQIHEIGEHDGRPFFSLEFCPGGSLERKLAGASSLLPVEAARLVETLAGAVEAAHRQHVLHRDIKPANVLLAADGQPKLTDFGLAKKMDETGQTASGAIMGTPSYMAPEQAGGKAKESGPAADVYSLGAILYRCLTGQPPFHAATVMDTLIQVIGDEPVPPRRCNAKIDRDLEAICLKCLVKDPRGRYVTAAALAEDLARFRAGDRLLHARPLTGWQSIVRWAGKNWLTAIFTGLLTTPLLFVYLLAVVVSLTGQSVGMVPVMAAVPGFFATMAVLIQPRREFSWRVGLIFAVALTVCWFGWANLQGPEHIFLQSSVPEGRSGDVLTDIVVPLLAGILPAALFGGTSRWIAKRYGADMLSVFFGGVGGAMITSMVCGCGILMVLTAPGMQISSKHAYVTQLLILVLAAVSLIAGFCVGGIFLARVTRRGPARV